MPHPLPAARWAAVQKLFLAAADLPAGEQESFLDTQCGEDRELRSEVVSLLRCDSRGETTVFEALRDEAGVALAADEAGAEAACGKTIGHWRLEREIGRGGMSVVYLGSRADGEFRKSVAIKLIKRGMDTDAVIGRMRQERGILASLDHPSIAHLLDGGTTEEGLPWIAMEYVDGVPIDRYCDEHGLSVRQRCELLIGICDALAYAHRNLVVHGDLKPGNILVGGDGRPRVLDFGIAKLLRYEEGETSAVGSLTRGLMRPFTPEYASPEQLAGAAIGTATDVYSLAAVLYELLTGVRPRFGAAPASAAAAGHGKDGRWCAQLRGDIDNILRMALRSEPERRYPAMAQFGLDLRRWLEGMPVAAQPDTLRYRAVKFVRRNRLGAAAAAAVVLALAGGIVVSTWEAGKARRAQEAAQKGSEVAKTERDRALAAEATATRERNGAIAAEETATRERNTAVAERERANSEAATAKAVKDFLENDLLGQASPNAQAGPDLKVRTALDRAAERLDGKFKGKPLVEADVRSTIGESYNALGLYAEAQKQYQRAWELRRGALGEKHRDTIDALISVAVLERLQGKLDDAEHIYNTVIPILRAGYGEKDATLLLAMGNLAVVYSHQQKNAQSAAIGEKVLAIQNQLFGPDSLDTLRTMNNLGVDYTKLGRFDDAERIYEKILATRRRVQGPGHPNTIFTANNLAVVYTRAGGRHDLAEKLYRESLEAQTKTLGAEHPDTLLTLNNLGLLMTTERRLAEAEGYLIKAAQGRERALGPAHRDTLESWVQAGAPMLLGERFKETETMLRPVCGRYAEAKLEDWEEYSCLAELGESLAGQARYAEAEPLLRAGWDGIRQREGSIPAMAKSSLDRAARWLNELYIAEGKPGLDGVR